MIDTLKAAFVEGMLAKDDFDLRVGQAFASRTCAELAAVTADLPAGLTAAGPPEPARARGEARVRRPGALLAVVTAFYAGMWPLAIFLPRDGEGEPQAGFTLVVIATFVYVAVFLVAVEWILESRRERRSGEQLPRRPTSAGTWNSPNPAS